MHHVFKTWLLWLLVLVLPAQGMAAALNASCGPMHRQTLEDAVGASAMRHADAGQAGHRHGWDAPALAAGEAVTADLSGKSAQTEHGQCSACAICPVGAEMMPPSIAWAPIASPPAFAVTSIEPLLPDHIPPRLERPPQSVFVELA